MAINSYYLETEEIEEIFDDHGLSELSLPKKERAVRQAIGMMESDLNKRFKIPLVGKGAQDFISAPEFTKMKVEILFRCSFLYVLGTKYMRNSDLADLGEFTADQLKQFGKHSKDMLDYQNDYNLELKPYAQDAVEPVQTVGIAKANNDMSFE